jgi:hypothetical protein
MVNPGHAKAIVTLSGFRVIMQTKKPLEFEVISSKRDDNPETADGSAFTNFSDLTMNLTGKNVRNAQPNHVKVLERSNEAPSWSKYVLYAD